MKSTATDIERVRQFAVVVDGECLADGCENPTPRNASVRAKLCSTICLQKWLANRELALRPVGSKHRRRRHVYFVECPMVKLVKIGVTDNAQKRFKDLQNMGGAPLVMVGFIDGDIETERAWHRRWSHLRHHGEWFHLSPELLDAIEYATIGRYAGSEDKYLQSPEFINSIIACS